MEIALAVAAGIADVGLGVRAAATDLDLDFVPVTWEHSTSRWPAALDAAAPLITVLREPDVRAAITALGGYDRPIPAPSKPSPRPEHSYVALPQHVPI